MQQSFERVRVSVHMRAQYVYRLVRYSKGTVGTKGSIIGIFTDAVSICLGGRKLQRALLTRQFIPS